MTSLFKELRLSVLVHNEEARNTSIEATASFVTLVGGNAAYTGDNVLRSEWLSTVNKLTDDPALRSDRTFVGCKSS